MNDSLKKKKAAARYLDAVEKFEEAERRLTQAERELSRSLNGTKPRAASKTPKTLRCVVCNGVYSPQGHAIHMKGHERRSETPVDISEAVKEAISA